MKHRIRRLGALALGFLCAFSPAYAQEAVITLPVALKSVEAGAFYGTSAIKKLIVPEGVEQIGERAFAESALTEVELPTSLQRIENAAFMNCAGMESILLPETLAYIADDAFAGCTSLTLTVYKDTPAHEWCEENGVDYRLVSDALTAAEMVANLRNDTSLGIGSKKEAMAMIAELMFEHEFEPAYIAGVLANVEAEGTYGKFESSAYISSPTKRPRYFAYLDGGIYYSDQDGDGVREAIAIYLSQEDYDAYDGVLTPYVRYSTEDYYRNTFSGKNMTAVDIDELGELLTNLKAGGWTGKFGLGICQWTGSRTAKLYEFYRAEAGSASSITKEQVIRAENAMMVYEMEGSYAYVYNTWKSANGESLDSQAAAESAGYDFCVKFERPADKESKGKTRGTRAGKIYLVMTGA